MYLPDLYVVLEDKNCKYAIRLKETAKLCKLAVTTMEMEPCQVIQFYCGRGRMENFIKEGRRGFDFASVSMRKQRINTIRLKLPQDYFSVVANPLTSIC